MASTALSIFLLGVEVRFVQAFVVFEKDSATMTRIGRGRIRTVTAISVVSPMPVPVPMPQSMPNCEQKEGIVCEDRSDEDGNEEDASDKASSSSVSLLCPSSCPSRTYGASNIKVTYQQIETDDKNCDDGVQLLPMQKHHARNPSRTTNTQPEQGGMTSYDSNNNFEFGETCSILGKTEPVRHDIPSLDFIADNLSRFPITKSSQVLLEEYQTEKKIYLEEYEYPSETETTTTTTITTTTTTITIPESSAPEKKHTDTRQQEQEQRASLLLLKKDRLRSKIRAECRASLPLAIETTLKILYCDAHICVVDKPSGVLSVPGHRRNPSLANLVYDTLEPSSYDNILQGSIDNIDQTVVHRLDMATSGIIVYALSKEALQELHVTFRDRGVKKTYQALVEGHVFSSSGDEQAKANANPKANPKANPNPILSPLGCCCGTAEGEIDVALERDPNNPPYMRIAQARLEKQYDNDNDNNNDNTNTNTNTNTSEGSEGGSKHKPHKFWREAPKPSKTSWSILSYEHDASGRPVTRIELLPHTGRTHQLRVHTSKVLGAPIVGDEIYGTGDGKTPLCLHARQLCLEHPISGAAMVFEADPPF